MNFLWQSEGYMFRMWKMSCYSWIGHVNYISTIQFCLEFPEILSQNHCTIDWVVLGIPKQCIMGYSLTCPIDCFRKITFRSAYGMESYQVTCIVILPREQVLTGLSNHRLQLIDLLCIMYFSLKIGSLFLAYLMLLPFIRHNTFSSFTLKKLWQFQL